MYNINNVLFNQDQNITYDLINILNFILSDKQIGILSGFNLNKLKKINQFSVSKGYLLYKYEENQRVNSLLINLTEDTIFDINDIVVYPKNGIIYDRQENNQFLEYGKRYYLIFDFILFDTDFKDNNEIELWKNEYVSSLYLIEHDVYKEIKNNHNFIILGHIETNTHDSLDKLKIVSESNIYNDYYYERMDIKTDVELKKIIDVLNGENNIIDVCNDMLSFQNKNINDLYIASINNMNYDVILNKNDLLNIQNKKNVILQNKLLTDLLLDIIENDIDMFDDVHVGSDKTIYYQNVIKKFILYLNEINYKNNYIIKKDIDLNNEDEILILKYDENIYNLFFDKKYQSYKLIIDLNDDNYDVIFDNIDVELQILKGNNLYEILFKNKYSQKIIEDINISNEKLLGIIDSDDKNINDELYMKMDPTIDRFIMSYKNHQPIPHSKDHMGQSDLFLQFGHNPNTDQLNLNITEYDMELTETTKIIQPIESRSFGDMVELNNHKLFLSDGGKYQTYDNNGQLAYGDNGTIILDKFFMTYKHGMKMNDVYQNSQMTTYKSKNKYNDNFMKMGGKRYNGLYDFSTYVGSQSSGGLDGIVYKLNNAEISYSNHMIYHDIISDKENQKFYFVKNDNSLNLMEIMKMDYNTIPVWKRIQNVHTVKKYTKTINELQDILDDDNVDMWNVVKLHDFVIDDDFYINTFYKTLKFNTINENFETLFSNYEMLSPEYNYFVSGNNDNSIFLQGIDNKIKSINVKKNSIFDYNDIFKVQISGSIKFIKTEEE